MEVCGRESNSWTAGDEAGLVPPGPRAPGRPPPAAPPPGAPRLSARYVRPGTHEKHLPVTIAKG